VTAPAKRELVRGMVTQGLSERRCLGIVGMSASALHYEPRPDRNVALRAQIVAWQAEPERLCRELQRQAAR
jgi:putative transposase